MNKNSNQSSLESFFKWRIVKGKLSQSRYDTLEMVHSPTHDSQTQKGIFLINELDENDVFYSIHATPRGIE